MRLKLVMTFVVLGLSGCSHQYPLIPKPESIQKIEGIKVTYILPNDIEKTPGTINGLNFLQYDNGTQNRIERLHFNTKDNQIEIERRTDNGIAGSGTIYTVNLDVVSKSASTTVTFIPKTQKTYQQGLILPFPIPSLDLESYLSDGMLAYKFEIDSDYPPEAVKANLQRLLGSESEDEYTLDNENELITIKVQIHHYRHNQSKVTIYARLYNKQSKNRTINFVEKINLLKTKLQNIVNS